MSLKEKIRKFHGAHPGLCEILRFLIVGGVATLVDMFVMGVTLYAFAPSLYPKFYNVWYGGGEPSAVATVVGTGCGFTVGLIVNYVFSVLFVFDHKGKSKSVGGFVVFTLLSAVGLGIHLGGMYVGYNVLGINEWIVKIVLTIVVLVYNYTSKRLLLFRKSKEKPQAESGAVPTATTALCVKGEKMKISIVVPCYNEEECIGRYYEAMQRVRKTLSADFEYIFVDDGSKDATLSLIRELADKDKSVRYLSFSRNFGKEAAILAGLKAADGDLVGLMDADLQDPPEMLSDMVDGIVNEGYDCVSCNRTDRKGESRVRSAFVRVFYKLFRRMTAVDVVDGARDYRLMTRKMTDAVLSLAERERFSKGIFAWVGFKTKWLPYHNAERAAGKTKWSFKKLTKYAIGGIEDFSVAPLRYNFVLCGLAMLAAVTFAVLDIVWACIGHGVSALFILLPVVCLLASLLFAGLGILGEYVKKIFYEVKARPVFVVRETDEDRRTAQMCRDVAVEVVHLAEEEVVSERETQESVTK